MKTSILSLSILLLSCYSCSTAVDENKVIQDSVIAVHDEVMPLMGDFVRNSMKIDTLLSQLPNLKETDTSLDTAQARVELESLKGKLDHATENMNDWMHDFQAEHEGKTKEQVSEYLRQELSRIKDVKEQFDAATTESSVIMEKYKNK